MLFQLQHFSYIQFNPYSGALLRNGVFGKYVSNFYVYILAKHYRYEMPFINRYLIAPARRENILFMFSFFFLLFKKHCPQIVELHP